MSYKENAELNSITKDNIYSFIYITLQYIILYL